jgi:WD40 repeat protein
MNVNKVLEFNGHNAAVYSVANDNNFIYSASADHFVARWDIKNGTQDKFAIKADNPVYSVTLSTDGKWLIMGLSNGAIHVIDIEEKKELRFIQQHTSAVFYITENTFKKHFYSCDASGNIGVWEADSFNLLVFIPLNSGKIRRVAVSPNGDSIIVCCQDGKIRMFDTTFFNEINTFKAHEGGVNAACFMSSSLLLTGGKDAMLRSWDIESNQMLREIPAHNYAIYDLVYMQNLNKVVSCSRDKTVKIWNAENLTVVTRIDRKLGGHFHSVNAIFRMTDSHFATCSDDKRIIVWKIEKD